MTEALERYEQRIDTEAVTKTMDALKVIRGFVAKELRDEVDYGKIPGTNDKKVMLLPGAQKVCMLYNCYPRYTVDTSEMQNGHVEFRVVTELVNRTTDAVVGSGVGSCSTMESKYRYRNASRKCPQCGKEAIIKGKAEYGGGWLCLSPDTPILYADFVWRPIGQAKPGDNIIGFDEWPAGKHYPRRFMPSTIQEVWGSRQQTKRLITSKADILTTSSHRWLRNIPSNGPHWMPTERLEVGRSLRNIGLHESPAITDEYRMGYLAGMTEGDGTMRYTPGQSSEPVVPYWRVAISSKDEIILGRLATYLTHFGVSANIRPFDGGPLSRSMQTAPLVKIETRALANLAVISNLIRPKTGSEFARGFLAGFFDAEGTGEGKHMRVYQNDVGTLEQFSRMASRFGFNFSVNQREDSCSNARLMGTTLDRIRFFSRFQPALLRKAGVNGVVMHHEADEILAIENGPMADLIDIQTSTGTFFAAGIATHNCFGKKGGCGAKFGDTDPAIISQEVGRIENEDIYDCRNTVLKMAKKRSLVDASIGLGCLTELFTQDIGDDEKEEPAKDEPKANQIIVDGFIRDLHQDPNASKLNELLESASKIQDKPTKAAVWHQFMEYTRAAQEAGHKISFDQKSKRFVEA